MSEFTKSRQLVLGIVPEPKQLHRKVYIEIPGYLYYYEPYEQHLFVHHKVVFDTNEKQYKMQASWVVSEPRTGLSIDSRSVSTTRKLAVAMAATRMLQITREQYHEAVLLGLANAPERKPEWKFTTHKAAAVRVKNDYTGNTQ